MILKDRYSKAFIFLTLGVGVSTYFLRNDKGYYSAIALLVGISPLLYLVTRPAKIHLTDEQKRSLSLEYKGEDVCGFQKQYQSDIDGVKINNQRFKAVNGTDIYIDENNNVNACGFGTSIMQIVGGGGVEPKSIQQETCWQ